MPSATKTQTRINKCEVGKLTKALLFRRYLSLLDMKEVHVTVRLQHIREHRAGIQHIAFAEELVLYGDVIGLVYLVDIGGCLARR